MPPSEDPLPSATGSVHIRRYKVYQARMPGEMSCAETVEAAVAYAWALSIESSGKRVSLLHISSIMIATNVLFFCYRGKQGGR